MRDRRDPTCRDRRRLVRRAGGRRDGDAQAEWVTVAVFAKKYGINRHTVYKWLEAGLLEIYRVGDLLRIRNLPPDQHVVPHRQMCAPVCTTESAGTAG